MKMICVNLWNKFERNFRKGLKVWNTLSLKEIWRECVVNEIDLCQPLYETWTKYTKVWMNSGGNLNEIKFEGNLAGNSFEWNWFASTFEQKESEWILVGIVTNLNLNEIWPESFLNENDLRQPLKEIWTKVSKRSECLKGIQFEGNLAGMSFEWKSFASTVEWNLNEIYKSLNAFRWEFERN